MANKNLFKTVRSLNVPSATAVNEAGGAAYTMPAKHALAQYVSTGTFNSTYYASAEDQLTKVLELVKQVEPEFVAQCAIYARERGFMKDMPAFLCAFLVSQGRNDLAGKVFSRIMDNPKMVRNFVQFLRSGVLGRKSLGTRPKKLVQQWLANHSELSLFRGSVGNDPSLADVIKMVHPKPATPERDALYRYLLGKEYDVSKLPAEVQAFEVFKKEPASATLPNVPFEMLTALPLTDKHWAQIAKNASWTQTRMNLNTFQRHNVFSDKAVEKELAARLANAELIKKAKVFPYQLLAAYLNSDPTVPTSLTNALQDAMEVAVSNIPSFDGKVYVCEDVSGSMHSASVTGHRKGATSKVTCLQVAALIAAAVIRRNNEAEVIPFSDHVVNHKLNPRDSVMTNATVLSRLPSGGTNCAAPLQHLNQRKAMGNLVIMVSDNQSWCQYSPSHNFGYAQATGMAAEWAIYKKRNPQAKLINIDLQPYTTTQVLDDKSVLNIGGFSDQVFDVVQAFASTNGETHWTDVIAKVEL
ncbi:MAG TPA: hypothetical protein VM577_11475 [Anaerovoracaceae bacterium]|nr:hypothetical protein [Anaerovoracaceae bacterium]